MNATDLALAVVSLEHMLAQCRLWGLSLEPIESNLQALISGVRTALFQLKLKLDKQTELSASLIDEVRRHKTLAKTQAEYFRGQLASVSQQVSSLSLSQKYSNSEKDSVIKCEEDKADRYRHEITLATNSLAYSLQEAKAAGYRPAKADHRTLMDFITELKFGFAQQVKKNSELSYTLKTLRAKDPLQSNDFNSKDLPADRPSSQIPVTITSRLVELQAGLAQISQETLGCKKFCEFTVRVMYGFILQMRKLKNLTAITSQKLSDFIKQRPEETLNASKSKLKGAVYAIMACLRMSKLESPHKERIIVTDQEILLPSYEISFKVGDWGANPMLVLSKMLELIEASQRNVGSAMSNYSYKSSL